MIDLDLDAYTFVSWPWQARYQRALQSPLIPLNPP